MIQTSFNPTQPTYQTNTSAESSASTISLKLVAETQTKGTFESLEINGNSIYIGYCDQRVNVVKNTREHSEHCIIAAYNADNLHLERTYEGPDGHDDISILFEDEKFLASISTCGLGATTYIWNKADGKLVTKLSSSNSIAHKDISLVTEIFVQKANDDCRIMPTLWNLSEVRYLGPLENATWVNGNMVIEGDFIYGGQKNGVIGVWNRFTGAFVKHICEERENARIESISVNSNVITVVETDTIRILDTKSGNLIKSIAIPGASPTDKTTYHQKQSHHGDLLEIKSFEKMQLWNIKEERLLYSLEGIRWLDADETSNFFSNERAEIEIRNKFDGKLTATLAGHPAHRPIDIKCKSAGKYLVSGSKDSLKVWNKDEATLVTVLPEQSVKSIAVKNTRIVAQIDNTLKMWDLPD